MVGESEECRITGFTEPDTNQPRSGTVEVSLFVAMASTWLSECASWLTGSTRIASRNRSKLESKGCDEGEEGGIREGQLRSESKVAVVVGGEEPSDEKSLLGQGDQQRHVSNC